MRSKVYHDRNTLKINKGIVDDQGILYYIIFKIANKECSQLFSSWIVWMRHTR